MRVVTVRGVKWMTDRSFRTVLFIVALSMIPLLAACGEDSTAQVAVPESASAPAAAHDAHAAHGNYAAHDAHGAREDHAAHDAHAHHGPALPAAELPGSSLFHLNSAWTNANGAPFRLPELRGRPSVVVMFYGDCTTACPLLVKTAQDIEAALPTELQGEVSFVMVTFATQADTPAKLKAYAASKDLDRDGWHWLVGSDLQTRQLATLLGVQYRDLGNGMFAHSNVVTVLDADGVPAARLEGLGVDIAPAVEALQGAS